MRNGYGIILDLDGTLYRFKSKDGTFANSNFCAALKINMYGYLAERLGLSKNEAQAKYQTLDKLYPEAMSLGVEKELGINRYDWFTNTWNLEPDHHITRPNPRLVELLAPFKGRALLLTGAPAVWTSAALQYLGLDQFFGDNVITGEDNLRKPHPAVFLKAASMLDRPCSSIISIGDQNPTDILPAKQLGMTTIRIGSIPEDADFVAPEICRALELARKI